MTTVEELREEIDDTLEDTANSLSPSRHKDFIGLDDVLDSLIASARAEGAEQMRQKVVQGSERFSEGDFVEDSDYIGMRFGVHSDNAVANDDIYVVPASVLSPAPKEKP